MSTRCHIIVKESFEKEHYIYHHSDGYPEGVGEELKEILEKCPSYDLETIVENILAYDSKYEEDNGIHGDEEYIYEIQIIGDHVILECFTFDDEDKGNLIFTKIYPSCRKEILDKYMTLGNRSDAERQAFLEGVWWVEEHPTSVIIKKILIEALNTVDDYSSELGKWANDIKKRLEENGKQGVISDS